MRIVRQCAAMAFSALMLSGCGWKMVQNPLRLQGQVLESGTNEPVEGAYIDIADEKDKLDFAIKTDITTDKNGLFDATYNYTYEKWLWLGIPVFWFRNTPEILYVEAFRNGYRRRIAEIEYPADRVGKDKVGAPLQLEPIRLVVDTPRRVYYRGEPIEGLAERLGHRIDLGHLQLQHVRDPLARQRLRRDKQQALQSGG